MIDLRKEVQTMLKADETVSALCGERIYLITSKKDDPFPRVIIREALNEPSLYADGRGWEAHVRLRLWMWSKTYDEFINLIDAVDKAMQDAKWGRKEISEDDYILEANVFEKSILYMRVKTTKPT